MDAVITSLIALYDINGKQRLSNSESGSIYIVKPKMHGPEEVAFTNQLLDRVEDMLKLQRHTIKVGHGRGAPHQSISSLYPRSPGSGGIY